MKDAPAFDFYPQRWLAGTMSMTAEERGAYMNLLCHQWEDDGLPNDTKRLISMAGCRASALPVVLKKFPQCEDGKLRNNRLEITRQEQRSRIAKSREKIEKMNAARASTRGSTRTSTRGSCRESTRPSSPLTTHHSPLPLEKETKGLPFSDEVQTMIRDLFKRRPDTEWSEKEIAAAKKLKLSDDQAIADIKLMKEAKEEGWEYYRREVLTLFGNWQGQVDKSRDYLDSLSTVCHKTPNNRDLFQ